MELFTDIDNLNLEFKGINQYAVFSNNLAGYAAADATKVLFANWRKRAKESSKPLNFIDDISNIVAELKAFETAARKRVPVVYGGFGEESPEYWLNELDKQGVSVYASTESPGYYGFSGCGAASYASKDAALSAALIFHYKAIRNSTR